jgi:hypothetical protein
MKRRAMLKGLGAGALSSALPGTAALSQGATDSADGPVFELRIYHTYDGKLDDLLARFRDHTLMLFKRHGLESVGYWTPTDDPLKGKTLVYLLKHPSRAAAATNWAAFRADPEWKQVSAASEANGKLVEKVDSTYMTLTDFSPKL